MNIITIIIIITIAITVITIVYGHHHHHQVAADGSKMYSGMADCFRKTYRAEVI